MDTITATAVSEIKALAPYALARMADCATPDSSTSPGADFLTSVRDAVVETIETTEDGDPVDTDALYSDVDGELPVYIHNLWETWVDLGAYQDLEEILVDVKITDQIAQSALALIGERLAMAILDEVEEAHKSADQ